MNKIAWIAILTILLASCTKGTNERYLIIKYRFSDTMPTYDDTGKIVTDADRALNFGIEALTPSFNKISSHYIGFLADSANQTIPVVAYEGDEYYGIKGSDSIGINYSSANMVKEGENFIAIPLNLLKPGTYKYLETEFSYQNITIPIRIDSNVASYTDPITGVQFPGNTFNGVYSATLAAFTGYKTFFDIGYTVNTKFSRLDSLYKDRGFYALETQLGSQGINYPAWVKTDKAGAVTTVNHLYKTRPNIFTNYHVAPIFSTKYLKNGNFIYEVKPLQITGSETESIVIECVLSTYKCFEWQDNGVRNRLWDPYAGEPITNIGFRGMVPMVIK